MSHSRLMMAGVTADGVAKLWAPDESAPSGVLGLERVLTPGSTRVLMVEVIDCLRLRKAAASEIGCVVLSSDQLVARCQDRQLSGSGVLGYGVRPNPKPHRRPREFLDEEAVLGIERGVLSDTCHITFTGELARRVALRQTDRESQPIEQIIDLWGPSGLPEGFSFDAESIFRALAVGTDVRTLVVNGSFA